MLNTDLHYSKVGIGTYLGDLSESVDDKIYNVIIKAIKNGINLIDTAPNYRCERSEMIIGKVVSDSNRKDLIISTKVGFLPFKQQEPENYNKYFQDRFINSGIINTSDIYGDWQSFHPDYIEWQLNESLNRLNTDYIDIYYLHNPDELLDYISLDKFYSIISNAFEFLNKMILLGKIKYIGISTWNGFLKNENKVDLNKIISIAKNTLDSDKFKFIQVPYNLAMTDYLTKKNQIDSKNNKNCSLIYLANSYNIDVMTSAPFYHGKLINIDLPEKIKNMFYNVKNNAELSLKFSLSNPGSNAVLTGVTNTSHLQEIISVLNKDLIDIKEYSKILMRK